MTMLLKKTIASGQLRILSCLGIALMLTACSTLPTSKPVAPKVTIESVKLVKFGLKYQEVAFNLDVFNPNNYALPLEALDFVAQYQGESLAEGSSLQSVDLPANENAALTVNVKTRLNKVLARLLAAAANDQETLDFTINGDVKLGNWPVRIPFNVVKSINNPVLKFQ